MQKNKKRKYVKPRLIKEKVFEQAALGCNKCTSGNPVRLGRCNTLLKTS